MRILPASPAAGHSGEPRVASALELDAFRAAFSGDATEAARLYRDLAHRRREPKFEHAARALLEDRVLEP